MAFGSDEIHRVAKGLCVADGFNTSHATMKVAEGFEVPFWITYISEAKKILREQQASKHK